MNPSQLAIIARRLARERSYWLDALAGDPEAATLPLDFVRAPIYAGEKAAIVVPLDAATGGAAWAAAREEPALMLAFLVAALAACLSRYTAREDLVIGTVVPEEAPSAAALNELVPLRLRLPTDLRAGDVLAASRLALRDAFRHARYPFDRLLELLALVPAPNRTPLVSTGVILAGFQRPERLARARTDLVVSGAVTAGRLTASVRYDARLFAPATAEVFVEHLARTIGWLLTAREAPLAALALMSREEYRATIAGFGASGPPPSAPGVMHHLVEAQVDRTPERPAVAAGARVSTYRQVEERANQLAAALRAEGIGVGSRVGVLLVHSIETVVAVLGVLKAGAAYVPLDTAHPAARIDAMLTDAAAGLVVTTSDSAALAGAGRRTLCLDLEAESLAAGPTGRVLARVSPGDLAYVIYTSGSTGTPKGVAVAHGALASYIRWARSAYPGGVSHDFALHSSLAFDLTVTSLFVSLIAGGTVVAYPDRDDEPPILDALRDDRVDLLKLTPSHLALVANHPAMPVRLRTLIVGGEALDAALARRIDERFGGRVAIFNEHGPTEATVGCMIHRFDSGRGWPECRSDRRAGGERPHLRPRFPIRAGGPQRDGRAVRRRRGPG